MIRQPNFTSVWNTAVADFQWAPIVKTEKWQGVKTKPEMATHELLNFNFTVPIHTDNLDHWREDIQPNLPWADDHFLERICGEPINPGEQWAKWPWGLNADKFRDENGQFNHNYMERYWPKQAGRFPNPAAHGPDRKGIRYTYGDLDDVINLLNDQPFTRQAYLPIWFPEDTGVVHGGRVPCSLGYHFLQRGGYLHINYYLRSCEIYRHFRDDCYLTLRLLLHVCEKTGFKPGFYNMFINSFHCFVNDRPMLMKTVFKGVIDDRNRQS